MSDKTELTRVKVGPGRLSFPYIFEMQNSEGGPKFGTTILLPPDYDTKPIIAALTAAAEAAWGKDKAKWPKQARKPEDVIRDCEEKSQFEGYAPGWKFISLSAGPKSPPGVVDALREEVTDPKEVYPGRWARLSANAYAYKNKTVGVTLGLNNVQLLRNDNSFGRASAKSDFDDYVEDSDEAPF